MSISYPRRAMLTCLAAGLAAAGAFCPGLFAAQADAARAEQAEAPKANSASLPRMEADHSVRQLEAGFQHLYELNFQGARAEFLAYQKDYPGDPLGKAAEAASYLFEQFNAKGVFTSAFFLNDSKLLGGVDGNPAENRNAAFLNANRRAREMAKRILKVNPRDTQGLLVLTITDGMEADYDALIEKKQFASLGLIRQADAEANNLLALNPEEKDAYVALGIGNYIIGCLPGYKRAFLWFGGIHGDRQRGIQQMESAASQGHYLRPFAKILLALAFEREHETDRARVLLLELTAQFPSNPLFAHELALIDPTCAQLTQSCSDPPTTSPAPDK